MRSIFQCYDIDLRSVNQTKIICYKKGAKYRTTHFTLQEIPVF